MPKPYAELFKRGIAVGYANIRNDSIDFQYRKENYSLPTIEAIGYAHYNGYFYEAKVSLVKKAAARLKESGHG